MRNGWQYPASIPQCGTEYPPGSHQPMPHWRFNIPVSCLFRLLHLLQRLDLRLQPGGNLLEFLRLRGLGLLKVFHGSLLFSFRLAAFGLDELLLGLPDLNVHFLRRRCEFLQRRRAKDFLPIVQGHRGKIGNRPFYFFNGRRINGRQRRNGWLRQRMCAGCRRGWLPDGRLNAGLEAWTPRIAFCAKMKPVGRGGSTQGKGDQREHDDPSGGPPPRFWCPPETDLICRCPSHGVASCLRIPSGFFSVPKSNEGREENLFRERHCRFFAKVEIIHGQ